MSKAALFALSLTVGLMVNSAYATEPVKAQYHPTMETRELAPAAMPAFKLVKTFEGQTQEALIRPVFSPSGRYLAANLAESNMVRVWDTLTGKIAADLKPELIYGQGRHLDGLMFTPDETQLLVLRAGEAVKAIDWRAQKPVMELSLGFMPEKIYDTAYSANGQWLILATNDGIACLDLLTQKPAERLLKGVEVLSLDLSRDGQWLAFARKGEGAERVGLVDLKNAYAVQYPITSLSVDAQKAFPKKAVTEVAFDDASRKLFIGFAPMVKDAKASLAGDKKLAAHTAEGGELLVIDLLDKQVIARKALAYPMMVSEPVALNAPFKSTLIHTLEPGQKGAANVAAIELLSPSLESTKRLTSAELDGRLMQLRISPDQKFMFGNIQTPAGVYEQRLFEVTPEMTEYPIH